MRLQMSELESFQFNLSVILKLLSVKYTILSYDIDEIKLITGSHFFFSKILFRKIIVKDKQR